MPPLGGTSGEDFVLGRLSALFCFDTSFSVSPQLDVLLDEELTEEEVSVESDSESDDIEEFD